MYFISFIYSFDTDRTGTRNHAPSGDFSIVYTIPIGMIGFPMNDAYSRDEVPVRCLPVFVIAWVVVLVIITAILYGIGDLPSQALGHLPTISYTAIGFPADRIFAIGLGVLSFLVVSVCLIESDVLHFWSAPVLGNLLFYVSLGTATLLFLTGQFNLGEIPIVHNLVAFFAFSSVVVLNMFSVIGEISTDHERLTTVKLSCIAVPVCNLFGLAFIAQCEKSSVQFDLLGVCEYVVVIGACIGTALWYFNFRGIQVLFCVELPRNEEREASDLPQGLMETEPEGPNRRDV
jgi:hypothetical protein